MHDDDSLNACIRHFGNVAVERLTIDLARVAVSVNERTGVG